MGRLTHTIASSRFLLVATLLCAAAAPLLVSVAWRDDFANGLDTNRWSFPLNGTCWDMHGAMNLMDSNQLVARKPGITLMLAPWEQTCPPGGSQGTSQAIATQIRAPASGSDSIFDIHFRYPQEQTGANAFFSMFSMSSACQTQLLFGIDPAKRNILIISANGNAANRADCFLHEYHCEVPHGFDVDEVHKYTIHWTSDHRVGWAVDGHFIHGLHEPALATACPTVDPYIILRKDQLALGGMTTWDIDLVAVDATTTSSTSGGVSTNSNSLLIPKGAGATGWTCHEVANHCG